MFFFVEFMVPNRVETTELLLKSLKKESISLNIPRSCCHEQINVKKFNPMATIFLWRIRVFVRQLRHFFLMAHTCARNDSYRVK